MQTLYKSTNLEHLETILIPDGDYNLVPSATKVPCVAEPTGKNQKKDTSPHHKLLANIDDGF